MLICNKMWLFRCDNINQRRQLLLLTANQLLRSWETRIEVKLPIWQQEILLINGIRKSILAPFYPKFLYLAQALCMRIYRSYQKQARTQEKGAGGTLAPLPSHNFVTQNFVLIKLLKTLRNPFFGSAAREKWSIFYFFSFLSHNALIYDKNKFQQNI